MTTIPQRALRNGVADVLRRAEAGEQFTVTVSGRPVAQVGPIVGPRFVDGDRLRDALGVLPPDTTLLDELREFGGALSDPFE